MFQYPGQWPWPDVNECPWPPDERVGELPSSNSEDGTRHCGPEAADQGTGG